MSGIEEALARQYVIAWLEHAGDVGFTAKARAEMSASNIDLPDIMSALKSSVCTTANKENANDLFLTLVGQTCDGDVIRMEIVFDPLVNGVCIHTTERL